MEFKDYYEIMGLQRNASPQEVKQAYRKLARKYHPDVSKEADAEERFKELGEAYEVLKDPEKRRQYDKYGQYWKEGGARQQQYQYAQGDGHSRGFNGAEVNAEEFEDFLNNIFQQRQKGRQSSYFDQGQDVHARLAIFLEDSYHGLEKILQLQMPVMDAKGQLHYQEKAVKVKIPQGITDKQQIRLKGQGGKGSGNHVGDLYIEISIAPHPFFKLENKDIHLTLPVLPWEAALGATVSVPTLGGTVKLKIPKLSQTGKQLRLKGRGLPGHPAGDQLVTLEIMIPPEANEKADKLYEALSESFHFNPRAALGV